MPKIKKVCRHCKMIFFVFPSRKDRVFCGRECAVLYKAANARPQRYCIDCGKKVYPESTRCISCHVKNRWKNKEYREKMVALAQMQTPPQRVCVDCGKPISKRATRCRKCSLAHQWAMNPDRWKSATEQSMAFAARRLGNRHFCEDCGVEIDKKGRSERCPSCAKRYMWTSEEKEWQEWRSKVVELRQSQSFRNAVSAGVKRAWARGDFDGKIPVSPTSIELQIMKALDDEDLPYHFQYRPMYSSFVHDFFVVPNILVEVNGTYWHTLPGAPERDVEKESVALDLGYETVTIWDREIDEIGALSLVQQRIVPIWKEYEWYVINDLY